MRTGELRGGVIQLRRCGPVRSVGDYLAARMGVRHRLPLATGSST
jgi:hypothetical protein